MNDLAYLLHVKAHSVNELHGGKQLTVQFENGWGASVVRHDYSYGGRDGLWELAVLDGSGALNYSTDITSDVIGNQTESEIRTLLLRIAALRADGRELEGDDVNELEA